MTIYQMPLFELQSLPELKQVEARLRELSSGSDSWTPLFSSSVARGGKRLRPALVLLCGSFQPAPRYELVDVATAAELIHTASLVHDDVIDQAESRRGQPTVSARWGTHQAVLYGDFLFARSFSLLTKHGYTGILENMTRAISLMCEGEIEQFARRFDCSVTEAEYMSYIHKKTAFFLSSCCLAGAEASGMEPVQRKLLASFGLQLGYAFQLTDDLLDFKGSQEITGKPVLHDLREGYLTLPVIKLLCHPRYGNPVREIIKERCFTQDSLHYVQTALHDSGILDEVSKKVRTLVFRAKQNLQNLPRKPARAVLARLADYIVQRES
ncbi:MAG: polyprenyl synthetase family protein [Bacillota bacterium]|nr:polyprenyl synthetase family protein [Bacillota bacterium]MDW7684244.1 polyprenyl synthetase family protein [Bacillota bacterium]